MEKAQLVVGFIRGTHGFSGECKVESASGEYAHLLKLKEVTLKMGDIQRETKVESVSLGNSVAYFKFEGINSDEEIKKLNRAEILVPRKYCKPLQKDEWYIEDLRNSSLIYFGEKVLASKNAPKVLGTVTDVLEGGSGYLIQVSLSDDDNREVFVPFNEQFIGKVDTKNQTIELKHLWILE